MDYACQKQTVTMTCPVMDLREEYAFSGDFVLPEYCPDVAVVLKCIITPYIVNRQWNADQLLLDGNVAVRVLYLDEERQCVRQAEFSQPISCTLRAENVPESAMVQVEVTPEYANCRATSPRRVEVRGAFLIHATARTADNVELLAADQEDGLYLQITQVPVTVPKAWSERMVAVNEVLDFDSELPEAEQLLGGDCQAAVQECKLLTGKAIVKGQLHVHQLYTDDFVKGSTYTLDFTLPFSQILDLDGVDENDLCTAEVTVLSDTQRTALNPAGQNAAMEVSAKLLVQVQAYAPATAEVVLDAYHTGYPAALDTRELPVCVLTGVQRQNAVVQKSLELPGGDLQEIMDVWVQPVPLPSRCEEGKAQLAGRLLISMLVRDAGGSVAYYERPEEFQLEYPAEGDSVQPRFSVMGVQYTVTDNRLDLRVSLAVGMTQWERSSVRPVTAITLQTDRPYPEDRAALKLYFAQPGEKVFAIARQCHSSPAAIRAENDLRDDTVPGKMVLLVPVP